MILRPFAVLVFAFVLVVTSQAMAVARGSSAAAGQSVLCIGSQAVTVYVDAQGQPTDAPRFCPDCVLSLANVSGGGWHGHSRLVFWVSLFPHVSTVTLIVRRSLVPPSRGPPLLV
ncbi:MAG: hypothetical protein ABJL67_20540 [Sulfitobacter sp.]